MNRTDFTRLSGLRLKGVKARLRSGGIRQFTLSRGVRGRMCNQGAHLLARAEAPR